MNKLKELRIEKKLSVRVLGEKTDIDFTTIFAIETGKRKMNINHAKALAIYFGVSIDYIMGVAFEDRLNNFITDCERYYVEVLHSSKLGDGEISDNGKIKKVELNIHH